MCNSTKSSMQRLFSPALGTAKFLRHSPPTIRPTYKLHRGPNSCSGKWMNVFIADRINVCSVLSRAGSQQLLLRFMADNLGIGYACIYMYIAHNADLTRPEHICGSLFACFVCLLKYICWCALFVLLSGGERLHMLLFRAVTYCPNDVCGCVCVCDGDCKWSCVWWLKDKAIVHWFDVRDTADGMNEAYIFIKCITLTCT